MLRYLSGRLAGSLVVLLSVSILAFGLMHAVPGGPFDEDKAPLPPAARANVLRKYGLDRPLYEQYLSYLGSAVRGDFGLSYQSPTETVGQLIGRTWPVSMQLGGLALVLAFGLGLTSGMVAAAHHNTWIDHLVTFVATLGVTVPNFVVAVWLLLVFGVGLGWLPTGGWLSGGDWKTLVMPVVSLALEPAGGAARRVHPDRAGQGVARAGGRPRPCPQERAHPADHRAGAADPQPAHRHDIHRGDLT